MTSDMQITRGQRLAAVMDHLGIEKAHVASCGFRLDIFDWLRELPESTASLTFLAAPLSLETELVEPLADRTVCMAGKTTLPQATRNMEVMRTWRGLREVEYPAGYEPLLWGDTVHDHTNLVVETLLEQASRWEASPVELKVQEGEVEEVTYRIAGSGPPLVLFPIGLAPTQWDAAMEELGSHFTIVRLGGEHLGSAAQLENRARSGTFLQGVRSMFDLLQIRAGDRVLEVGTGQGTFARDLAIRTQGLAEVVGVDINEYMLGEARNFARKASLVSPLRYEYGNAESLPYEDESFDVAFSVTVFEECDADKAIAELYRVLKPGGHAGVIIRSRDLPGYSNLNVSDPIKRKINVPDPNAPVSLGGCVDSSLYARFAAKFSGIRPNAWWNTITDPQPQYFNRVKGLLDETEVREFDEACSAGRAAGTFFAANPLHCVVGTRAS